MHIRAQTLFASFCYNTYLVDHLIQPWKINHDQTFFHSKSSLFVRRIFYFCFNLFSKGPIRWIWALEISPNSINPSQEESFAGYPLLPSNDRELKSQVELLDDKIIHIILEYFIDDYATMRHVSKSFRRAFDDLIYATCWMKFPGFTKDTFSFWNYEDPTMKKRYLKYQLIPLLRVVSFYMLNN